jgi:phospholipid/cholesterol/gamma-HCH transport system substrate-binding protein
MSKRILANLVVFVTVFLVMCVWAVRNVVTFDAVERPYELEIDLQAASGLAPGAEVAYLGVNYGRVGDIELVDGGVRATLKIDDGREIPRGSVASVFRKSAIGEPYIDFQPPEDFDFDDAGDDDFYQPGDLVPVEDTRNPIEFSELLRTASALISEIEPERAATLLHELALALDGRGDDLREMTEASDTLAATFAERTDVLDRLAVNNTRLTRVLAEHRGSLGQSVSDLAALAESLRNASGDTQVLLDRGTQLLAEVGDLVADARPSLDCILANLVVVNDRSAEPAQLDNLALHLDIGPAAYAQFATTQDIEVDGPWVRVNLTSHQENPARQYEPPLELPAVPAVPSCPGVRAASSSTATPATTDFRPAEVLANPGGASALPATGAGVAASGAVAAALAAFTVFRVTRRAR